MCWLQHFCLESCFTIFPTGLSHQQHGHNIALWMVQVNYNLMSVNAFMAMTGLYQLSRKIRQDYGQQLGLAPEHVPDQVPDKA